MGRKQEVDICVLISPVWVSAQRMLERQVGICDTKALGSGGGSQRTGKKATAQVSQMSCINLGEACAVMCHQEA